MTFAVSSAVFWPSKKAFVSSLTIVNITSSGQITDYNGTPFVSELTKEYIKELVDSTISQSGKGNYLFLRFFDIHETTDLPKSKAIDIAMKSGTIQSSTGDTYLTKLLKKDKLARN